MPTIHRSRVTLLPSRESGQPSNALELPLVAVYSTVQPHNPQAEETKQLAKPSLAVSLPVSCRGLARGVNRVRSLDVNGRGRDVSCLTPPAQIRTCRIAACGSYLGCLASKRRLG